MAYIRGYFARTPSVARWVMICTVAGIAVLSTVWATNRYQ